MSFRNTITLPFVLYMLILKLRMLMNRGIQEKKKNQLV